MKIILIEHEINNGNGRIPMDRGTVSTYSVCMYILYLKYKLLNKHKRYNVISITGSPLRITNHGVSKN